MTFSPLFMKSDSHSLKPMGVNVLMCTRDNWKDWKVCEMTYTNSLESKIDHKRKEQIKLI